MGRLLRISYESTGYESCDVLVLEVIKLNEKNLDASANTQLHSQASPKHRCHSLVNGNLWLDTKMDTQS